MDSQKSQLPDTHEWERVLWKKQPYPDNYIPPESFLASLERNRKFSGEKKAPSLILSLFSQLQAVYILAASVAFLCDNPAYLHDIYFSFYLRPTQGTIARSTDCDMGVSRMLSNRICHLGASWLYRNQLVR